MAVVRQARSTPPIALITFVFLFLVATGLAIYLGLGMAQASKARADAETALKQVVHLPGEHDLLTQVLSSGASADSALKTAMTQRNQQMALAAKLQEQVTRMTGELADMKAERDRLTQENAALHTEVTSASAPLNSKAAELQARIDKLDQDVQGKQDEIAKTNDTYHKTIDDAQKEWDKKVRDYERLLRDAANMRQTLEDQVAALVKELKEARQPAISGNEHPILWQADGHIIHTTPLGTELWIDIGRKDHLKLNTTFTVYDPKLGVGSGPDSRGKGAIEVIQVGETQSRARITHTEPGETLLENDVIANLVFNRSGPVTAGPYRIDRSRVYKFYVYGDFDLDGDGIATPSETEEVKRMIRVWGGEVVDKLDTQTDFLVLGADPAEGAAGETPAVTDATTAPGAQTEPGADLDSQKKSQRDQRMKLVAAAKDYAIPVMDANRFFAYIGYYNNTIVGAKR